jgi:DNA-binding CsgD family transcriptional regulator
MAGFTITARASSMLRDVVASARGTEPQDAETPLSWELLVALRELVPGDFVCVNELDVAQLRHPRVQSLGDHRVLAHESVEEARESHFWLTYWPGPCSYADRVGDYESVTTLSDFMDLTSVRSWAPAQERWERDIQVPWRLPEPGHHMRLLIFRERGRDFSQLERFYLTLLRPHLVQAYWAGVRARTPAPDLTPRQLALLALVRDGHTNVQIAHRLGLAEGTVRTHLNHIYARLEVPSRTAAVTKVYGASAALPRL